MNNKNFFFFFIFSLTLCLVSSSVMDSEGSTTWTEEQNKRFEDGLAIYLEKPNFLENMVRYVGDKSAEDIQKHFDLLVEDLELIESGKVPLPNYEEISDEVITKKAHKYIAEEQRG